jgi:hypothetical protein
LVLACVLSCFATKPRSGASQWKGRPILLLTAPASGVTAESNERVIAPIADQLLKALA